MKQNLKRFLDNIIKIEVILGQSERVVLQFGEIKEVVDQDSYHFLGVNLLLNQVLALTCFSLKILN